MEDASVDATEIPVADPNRYEWKMPLELLFIGQYKDPKELELSSDESSAQSNSIMALPDENIHQEEPLEEENIPLPNQNNLPFHPFDPLDPVDQFRLLNLDTEIELFARHALVALLPSLLCCCPKRACVVGCLTVWGPTSGEVDWIDARACRGKKDSNVVP
ncbi:hypothetical protein LguiA_035955 [Lonicera macranthoides]